jgi:ribosomal protein S18 acetylase RimI-like enzyme
LASRYAPADEAAVVDLWQLCGLTRGWNDPRKDIQRKLTVQPELFLVGEVGGQIVASVMGGYEGHRGWVNYLAVAPEHRARGYGRLLMRHVEAQLAARGCPKLNLQVRAGNEEALAFYRKIGYAVEERVSLGKRLIPDR